MSRIIKLLSLLVMTLILIASTTKSVSAMELDIHSSTSVNESVTVKLIISDSKTLMLNEKHLHIDFLSDVLMGMQIRKDVNIELRISSNAPMGVVNDTQQILNELGIEPTLVVDLQN